MAVCYGRIKLWKDMGSRGISPRIPAPSECEKGRTGGSGWNLGSSPTVRNGNEQESMAMAGLSDGVVCALICR